MTTAVMTGQTNISTVSKDDGLWSSVNPFKADPTVLKPEVLKAASDNLKSQFAAASSEKDFKERVKALTSVLVNAGNLEYESTRAFDDTKTSKIISAGGKLAWMSGAAGFAFSLAGFAGTTAGAIGAMAAASPYLFAAGIVGGVGVGAAWLIQDNFSAEAKFRDNAHSIQRKSIYELKDMLRSNPEEFKKAFEQATDAMPQTIKYVTSQDRLWTEDKSFYAARLYTHLAGPRPAL